MEDNEIKDFKEWNVPTKWEDITLSKYQEIERYYEGKEDGVDVRDIIHILCDKTRDEVNELPAEFLETILIHLQFLTLQPKIEEPTNKIVIDGDEYMINFMEKLKTGEYIDTDTILKSDRHNYAAILGILCRKEGEKYNDEFIAEKLPQRIEMFEGQPITNILPLIAFFLTLSQQSAVITQLSLQAEEGLNLTASDIEHSHKSGAISRHFMKLLMKKLKKLRKSLKHI